MESDFALLVSGKVPRLENVSLDDANAETAIISTLDVDEYHDLCSDYPISQRREVTVSTQLPIPLGSMFFHSRSQPEALFTATGPLYLNFKVSSWSNEEIEQGQLMANSWIRYFTLATVYFPPLISWFQVTTRTKCAHLGYMSATPRIASKSSGWRRQITFSPSFRQGHTSRITVLVTKFGLPTSNNPFSQSARMESYSTSVVYPTRTTLRNPRAICSFAHPRISELDKIHFSGQLIQRIGPSVQLALPLSAQKTQQSSDFP